VYRSRKLTTLAFIAFEWLNESNSTTLCDPRNRSKSMDSWAFTEIFPGGQRWTSSYPFQVADDVIQMGVHKTLYPFYLINLCWLNLNSQSFVWNVFCTSAISEMLFIFIKCLISIFEHSLQRKHNLWITNDQNNMSGEKTRKLDTLSKLF